ncbi:MAG: peptidylprolyl isomerase, partial [Polyangiaceae bacterium]
FTPPPAGAPAGGSNPRVPEEVRAAVFEIANVGDVLPRVIASGGTFYVVKLEGRSEARDRSFEDAERSIRVKLATDKLRASESALLDELRKQYPVTISEQALSQVPAQRRVEAGAPGDAGAK